jgi:hypothetical protein
VGKVREVHPLRYGLTVVFVRYFRHGLLESALL